VRHFGIFYFHLYKNEDFSLFFLVGEGEFSDVEKNFILHKKFMISS